MSANRYPCYGCGRPLDPAMVLRRRYRVLRSGDSIGGRGKFVTFDCECGAKPTRLWNVTMPALRTRRIA